MRLHGFHKKYYPFKSKTNILHLYLLILILGKGPICSLNNPEHEKKKFLAKTINEKICKKTETDYLYFERFSVRIYILEIMYYVQTYVYMRSATQWSTEQLQCLKPLNSQRPPPLYYNNSLPLRTLEAGYVSTSQRSLEFPPGCGR